MLTDSRRNIPAVTAGTNRTSLTSHQIDLGKVLYGRQEEADLIKRHGTVPPDQVGDINACKVIAKRLGIEWEHLDPETSLEQLFAAHPGHTYSL